MQLVKRCTLGEGKTKHGYATSMGNGLLPLHGLSSLLASSSEMTYIVSGGALNSTHSAYCDNSFQS